MRLHHFGMSTIRLPHAHTDHTKTCADRLPRPPALQDSGTTGSCRSATEPTSMPSDCNRTWRAIEQLAFAGFLNPTLLRRNSNYLCSHPSRMIALPPTNPTTPTCDSASLVTSSCTPLLQRPDGTQLCSCRSSLFAMIFFLLLPTPAFLCSIRASHNLPCRHFTSNVVNRLASRGLLQP